MSRAGAAACGVVLACVVFGVAQHADGVGSGQAAWWSVALGAIFAVVLRALTADTRR